MKQTSKMVMLSVALLAGISGTAWANGTEIPPPEPSVYTPPPPPPMEMPATDNTGPYISGAIGIGFPGTLKTQYDITQTSSSTETVTEPGKKPKKLPGNRWGWFKNHQVEESESGSESTVTTTETQTVTEDGKFDLDSGLVLNGAVGYNFGSTRLEAAVGYQKHAFKDADDEDISILTVMANAYYDFEAGSGIKPYVMGGLGMAHVDMSIPDESENVFAWQVGAGLGIKVSERATLDLGYRYLKPNKFDTHGLGDGKIECHNIMLGLRYQF